jgi:hypothetical protein
MNEDASTKIMEAAVDRLFSLPQEKAPSSEEDRLAYASAASATFSSRPFRVLVVEMRDHLTKLAVNSDARTVRGDWIRGGIYALDQLYQRYQLLDGEHKEPKNHVE